MKGGCEIGKKSGAGGCKVGKKRKAPPKIATAIKARKLKAAEPKKAEKKPMVKKTKPKFKVVKTLKKPVGTLKPLPSVEKPEKKIKLKIKNHTILEGYGLGFDSGGSTNPKRRRHQKPFKVFFGGKMDSNGLYDEDGNRIGFRSTDHKIIELTNDLHRRSKWSKKKGQQKYEGQLFNYDYKKETVLSRNVSVEKPKHGLSQRRFLENREYGN